MIHPYILTFSQPDQWSLAKTLMRFTPTHLDLQGHRATTILVRLQQGHVSQHDQPFLQLSDLNILSCRPITLLRLPNDSQPIRLASGAVFSDLAEDCGEWLPSSSAGPVPKDGEIPTALLSCTAITIDYPSKHAHSVWAGK